MRKQSLIKPNALLFLNNYLHIAKRRTLNKSYDVGDKSQMSFTERVVLYSLLMETEPFDEQIANECWGRLLWLLSEIKEITDLNEFVAQVSLSKFLAKELIAALKRNKRFFNLNSQTLAEQVKTQRKFPAHYGTVLSLTTILPPLRKKELEHLKKRYKDHEDTHDYYLFTEGCIDLCLIQNAPKLVPLFTEYVAKYLELFKSPETRWDLNIFTWEKQREIARKILEEKRKFGKHFWLQPDDLQTIDNEYGSEFRLIETLLVMQSLGELTVSCDCPNVMRGDLLCLSIDLAQKREIGEKTQENAENPFRFGNSLTDTETHYIWKDGDRQNGQKFNNGSKRRYIWAYCRDICVKGAHSQSGLDKFVSEGCKRREHVTTDDMKAFLPIIARYSDVPLKELSNYITFKEGKGIEVKKVPL